jgi:hypothetical protein
MCTSCKREFGFVIGQKPATCPVCGTDNTTPLVDHYFCNNCLYEFHVDYDTKKWFPYNVIFPLHPLELFYRKSEYTIDDVERELAEAI